MVFYGFLRKNFNKILVNDNVSYFAINNQKYTITNIKEVENRYGDNEYHVYVDVEGNPSKQTSRKRK